MSILLFIFLFFFGVSTQGSDHFDTLISLGNRCFASQINELLTLMASNSCAVSSLSPHGDKNKNHTKNIKESKFADSGRVTHIYGRTLVIFKHIGIRRVS